MPGDKDTAAVLVDWLPHHSHIVNLWGNSCRMRELSELRGSMQRPDGGDEAHQGTTP